MHETQPMGTKFRAPSHVSDTISTRRHWTLDRWDKFIIGCKGELSDRCILKMMLGWGTLCNRLIPSLCNMQQSYHSISLVSCQGL